MPQESDCPKCGGNMEQGYSTESFNIHLITRITVPHFWLSGTPVLNRWGGIDQKRTDPSKAVPITIFRCATCGYLESFARPSSKQ